ncbi:HNH endonuclease signature motif containing protein [Nocardioides marmoraquaticus]
MTAAPDLAEPLLAELALLHTCLDRLLPLASSPNDPTAALRSIERSQRRLDAARLRVIAAAEAQQTAAAVGLPSTGAWAARETRTSGADAARETRLATDLDRSPAGPTATALGEGDVSTAHATVITRALDRLPTRLTDAERLRCESRLVAEARRCKPDQLRRLARRVLAEVEPDEAVVDAEEDAQVTEEEDRAYAATSLSFHDNGDGTVTGRFTLPQLQAAMLKKMVEAMAAPRRTRGTEHTSPDHARGIALATLVEHLPTDHLTGATSAQVVVTMSIESLRGALRAAGIDTDQPISAGQARRLACNASLMPAVLDKTLGGASRVLDLGRSSRLFNDTQRTAVAVTHRHCAAAGCDRPVAWCELHHRTAWSHGGRTDLADAIPLCHWHHRRVHDHRYRHEWRPDGSVSFVMRSPA